MTDDATFLAAINVDPSAPEPKQVYADWLEEQGRADEALAMRYLARAKKWPERLPDNRWRFYRRDAHRMNWTDEPRPCDAAFLRACLPLPLLLMLMERSDTSTQDVAPLTAVIGHQAVGKKQFRWMMQSLGMAIRELRSMVQV